jgi:hypothetical protein
VGRDPDGGTCEGAIAWHVEAGEISGVDVSALTVALLAHLPGNPLHGNWRVIMFIDGNATDEQQEALLEVFTGRAGGPVADFAGLVGEVVDVRRVPITFDLSEGSGRFEAGPVRAEVEALVGATGNMTDDLLVRGQLPRAFQPRRAIRSRTPRTSQPGTVGRCRALRWPTSRRRRAGSPR